MFCFPFLSQPCQAMSDILMYPFWLRKKSRGNKNHPSTNIDPAKWGSWKVWGCTYFHYKLALFRVYDNLGGIVSWPHQLRSHQVARASFKPCTRGDYRPSLGHVLCLGCPLGLKRVSGEIHIHSWYLWYLWNLWTESNYTSWYHVSK